jgi:hypothetical protein
MAWNEKAPQDSATAGIVIVMSSLLLVGSVVALFFLDLSQTGRGGIPMWVIVPSCAIFAALGVIHGIRMHVRHQGKLRAQRDGV